MADRFRPNYGHARSPRDRPDSRRSYHENRPLPSPRRNGGSWNTRQDHDNGYYAFRGAASRDADRSQRPEETFSFRAINQPAPRFPSPDRRAPPQKHTANRPNHSSHGAPGRRIDRSYGSRGRGGYRVRKAHTRDILNKVIRGGTPEQLHGMNDDGQAHFTVMDSTSGSDSEDEDNVVDLTRDSDEEQELGRARFKRVRTEALQLEPIVPKWSNPDPYTSLPPPENAPKKDILKVIRKAKIGSTHKDNGSNAVKANDDFISFDSDGASEDGEISEEEDFPPSNAPSAPASMRTTNAFNFSSFQSQPFPSAATQGSNFDVDLTGELSLPPPVPPKGVRIPSKTEIAALAAAGRAEGNKKRKRDQQSKDIGRVVPEWQPDGSDPTPWCQQDWSGMTDMNFRLHNEICEFAAFVRPFAHEEEVRRDLVTQLEGVLRRMPTDYSAPSIQLHSFGSFASGVYLPTADMDLVAVTPMFLSGGRKNFCQSNNKVRQLGTFLQEQGVSHGAPASVTKAKVPIVKFIDQRTGLRVDISFENDSGLRANRTFQDWKVQYPEMPTLVVVIKQLLAMRGLNEVFTGGLGGFSITCLVVSMLQMLPARHPGHFPDNTPHYGELLLHFLNLYGNNFDIVSTGIRMNPPGYFDKIQNPFPKQNPRGLTIIDPNRPDHDISGGSRNIDIVFGVFRDAHAAIRSRVRSTRPGLDVNGSFLQCILGGNYSDMSRQRNRLNLVHQGVPTSELPELPATVSAQHQMQGGAKPPPTDKKADEDSKGKKKKVVQRNSPYFGMTKSQTRVAKAARRAERFKQKHPEAAGVPEKISKKQRRSLLKKYHS